MIYLLICGHNELFSSPLGTFVFCHGVRAGLKEFCESICGKGLTESKNFVLFKFPLLISDQDVSTPTPLFIQALSCLKKRERRESSDACVKRVDRVPLPL